MSWTSGIFTRGMDSTIHAADMARMKAEMQLKHAEMQLQRQMANRYLETGMHFAALGKPAPSKCPGCGSHEWRQHNNVRICAYCRSGQ